MKPLGVLVIAKLGREGVVCRTDQAPFHDVAGVACAWRWGPAEMGLADFVARARVCSGVPAPVGPAGRGAAWVAMLVALIACYVPLFASPLSASRDTAVPVVVLVDLITLWGHADARMGPLVAVCCALSVEVGVLST